MAAGLHRYPSGLAVGMFAVMIAILGHMGFTTGLMSFATINAFGIDLWGTTPLLPGLVSLLSFVALSFFPAGLLCPAPAFCRRCVVGQAHA